MKHGQWLAYTNQKKPIKLKSKIETMTIKTKAVELLAAKRIPANDAASIIDFAAPQITGCDWDGPAKGQNDLFFLILMQEYVKPLALQWTETNKPETWYKSMFTP